MVVDLRRTGAHRQQGIAGAQAFPVAYVDRERQVEGPFLPFRNTERVRPRQESHDMVRHFTVAEQGNLLAHGQERQPHRRGAAQRVSVRIDVAAYGNGFRFPYRPGNLFKAPVRPVHRLYPPFPWSPPALWQYARRIQYSGR